MRRIRLAGFVVICACVAIMSATVSFSQEGDEAVATAVAEATPSKVRPLTVAAGLIDDTVITGTLTDSTAITIKTAFGEASIPLSEVAGIRFPAAEDTSTTIVMLNGDSITGATDLKYASVETTWGSAKINGQNIASMLFVPGLQWQPVNGLAGKRWNLLEATKPASNTAQPNSVQPASGSRPLNGQPQIIFGQ